MIPQAATGQLDQMLAQLARIPVLQPGNITSLWGRRMVHNPDGSISTTYSTSYRDDKGREVLIPTVYNGAHHTGPAAWQHYLQTGQHLGIFQNAHLAELYANLLHTIQAVNNQPAHIPPSVMHR